MPNALGAARGDDASDTILSLTDQRAPRVALMSKDRTRQWFVDGLARAREKHHFDLWAWVIMPEHVHLLICPLELTYRMETLVPSITKPVSHRAIQFLQEQAPEFLEKLTVRNRNRTYRRFWQAGPGYDASFSVWTEAIMLGPMTANACRVRSTAPLRNGASRRPHRPPAILARLLSDLSDLQLTLTFLEDGLHVVVTVSRK